MLGRSGQGPTQKVSGAALGGVVLAIAIILFAFEQSSIAEVNGWWLDEIYSLWVTDPSLTFANAFEQRILFDPTTPPLYYLFLYLIRSLISVPVDYERGLVITLNLILILFAALAVVRVSWRTRLTGIALIGVAAFLLSGPVSEYAPEGRAYLMAMAIGFCVSWFTALAIEEPGNSPHLSCFIAAGILAALTHLYAALLCGGLAAGLILLVVFGARRDLLSSGLALGLSASFTCATWYSFAFAVMKNHITPTIWTSLTVQTIVAAYWDVKQLEVGAVRAAIALIILISCALAHRSTRPLTLAFVTAFAVFIVLPILASFATPIIVGRYWLIGGPSLVVLMVFLAKKGLLEAREHPGRIAPLIIGLGVTALCVSSSITGFVNARKKTEDKFVWTGAAIVAPLIHDCPAASVHIRIFYNVNEKSDATANASVGGNSRALNFAQIAHAPANVFEDVVGSRASSNFSSAVFGALSLASTSGTDSRKLNSRLLLTA